MTEPLDYKKAYEKEKLGCKQLQKKLVQLEEEIHTRCRNYMQEIARLKNARPAAAVGLRANNSSSSCSSRRTSEISYQVQPCSNKKNLSLSQRVLDLKLEIPVTTPGICIDNNNIFEPKMASSSITTTAFKQSKLTSSAETTTVKKGPELADSELNILSKFSAVSPTKVDAVDDVHNMSASDIRELENSSIKKDQEIQVLKKEVKRLRKIRIEAQEARKSYRESMNAGRSSECSVDDEDSHNREQQLHIKHLETELRMCEEKVYVYESIFVNIYNLLIKDKKESMNAISQIRSVKYNDLEIKLRTLFSLIKINQDNLLLINREKEELLKQLEMLSNRVNILAGARPITHEAQVQTGPSQENPSMSRVKHKSYHLEIPMSPGLSSEEYLHELKQFYEEEIDQKYAQIRNLKQNLKSVVEEMSRGDASSCQRILSYSREYIERDCPLGTTDSQYVKRVFSASKVVKRKVLGSRGQQTGQIVKQKSEKSIASPTKLQGAELVMRVLTMNTAQD